jgi:hypothetical protein
MATGDAFRTAKAFSDYLAFHVRYLFCATVCQFLLAIPVTDVISGWERGGIYSPSSHLIELLVAAVFGAYSITMYIMISRTVWEFAVSGSPTNRWVRVGQRAFGIVLLLVETVAILAVTYGSTTLLLSALNIPWDRAVCAASAYLSDTNYAFTPPKPPFCP